ncbi:GNAT family N-acetyltransferase [bacterium]|nr:GNAT family N-acetyltransferase [bacterium]
MLKRITASDTRELRRKILRPHQRPEDIVYPNDDCTTTFHVGFFEAGCLQGVASTYEESTPKLGYTSTGKQYRLRGMAVDKHLQGQGIGSKLIKESISLIKKENASTLWCNARTSALGFYRKLGFETTGDEFEIEGIGPHYIMFINI